jgi:hypothetical protein
MGSPSIIRSTAMPATINPLQAVMKRLKAAKIDTGYVKQVVLPAWWENSLALEPVGFAEAVGYLSRGLGIKPESFYDPSAPLVPDSPLRTVFKASRRCNDDDLASASAIASRIAGAAASACAIPLGKLPPDAAGVRSEILAGTNDVVDFQSLLDYCWSKGVIVLGVTRFAGKKPDGMALKVGTRPVIILCKSTSHPAWSAFDLGHELGHLALGHVDNDGLVLDKTLDGADTDQEEREANDFAAEVLTGSRETSFGSNHRLRAEMLVASAKDLGRRMRVDPGVMILNYARTMERIGLPCWGLAQAALKSIPSNLETQEALSQSAMARLNWDHLSRDTRNWLLEAMRGRR